MTTHDRARELAAASPQFELSTDERAELETHLAMCDSCRAWADEFTSDLTALRALPGIDAPDRVARAVLGGRAGGRRGQSRVAVVVAIGVLVVAAAPIAILGIFRGFSSGAAAPPDATAGATGAPPGASRAPASAAPTAGSTPPAIAWAQIPPKPGLGAPAPTSSPPPPPPGGGDTTGAPMGHVTALRSVTWLPDRRYVAVGEACPPEVFCYAAIATSADGETWRVVDDPPGAERPSDGTSAGMRDVTVGGPGVVAVGSVGPYDGGGDFTARIWTSPGGRRWSGVEVEYPGTWMNAVTALPDGTLVAVGGALDSGAAQPSQAAAWTSADGATWQRIEGGSAFVVGDARPIAYGRPIPGMSDVAWVLGRLIAVGSACDAAGCEGVAWSSAEGASWTRLEPGPFGTGRPVAIAGDDDLAIVVGSDLEGKAVWRSVDGETWERDALESAGPDSELLAVVRSEAGWIAGGTSSGQSAGLWGSSDGLTWSPSEDAGAFLGGTVLGLAADADTIVAVGTADEALLPMIWVGTFTGEAPP